MPTNHHPELRATVPSCLAAWRWRARRWFGRLAGAVILVATTLLALPSVAQTLPSVLDPGVTQVVAGTLHTCALSTAGGVSCWGYNEHGQLGTTTNNGTDTANPAPTTVPGLASGVVALAAGDYHTCALNSAGGVSCWGTNFFGQLGTATNNGTAHANATPTAVPGLTSGVVALVTGGFHTCALSTAGGVSCWGYNRYGQLGTATGNGTNDANPAPTPVPGLASGVVALAAGENHTCALSTAGGVRCWGYNEFGQLGTATNNGNTNANPVPTPVPGLASGVVALTAGGYHTCALNSAGGVSCWGNNNPGQLGTTANNGTQNANPTPTPVPGLASGVVALAAGAVHTCALSTAGGLRCWGANNNGQLGTTTNSGTTNANSTPIPVPGLASGVAALTAGAYHTCALSTAGGLRCWGTNRYGQLGTTTNNGTDNANPTPASVPGLTSGVVALAAGDMHTCALSTAGGVSCWGSNFFGQLGTTTNSGTFNANSTPIPVPGLASGVVALAAGAEHTCALSTAGGVSCWGDNFYGQLGTTTNNGADNANPAPTPVTGLTSGVVALAAGDYHTCAVTTAGDVSCWGYNEYGQLGTATNNGTENATPTPTPVPGLPSRVVALMAGANHTCALSTTGGVHCWGDNHYGELGTAANNGTGNANPVPTAVPGFTSGVVALAAGEAHTCALRTAGDVSCWGRNGYGQLGSPTNSGTSNANPTPTSVTGLASGVLALAAGGNHTCALSTSGGVRCWGYNYFGQLGTITNNSTIFANPTPTAVPGLASDVAALAARGSHTCEVSTAGGVRCWGANTDGQLGSPTSSGTTNPNPTPADVRGGQTISFTPPATFALGTSATLSASASSGLAPSFDSWTPATCTVSPSGTVTPLATALCGVRVSQPGDGNFAPAPQALALVRVVLAPVDGVCGSAQGVARSTAPSGVSLCQSGTASAVGSAVASFTWSCAGDNGGNTASCSAPRQYTVTATATPAAGGSLSCGGGASVAVTAGNSTTCTASPSAGYVTASIGGCAGSATTAGINGYTTGNISADCTVTASFLLTQSITAPTLPSRANTGTTITLGGSASSGLPLVYSAGPAAVCTLSGNLLTLVGPGACQITITQPGNGLYAAAPAVTVSINADALPVPTLNAALLAALALLLAGLGLARGGVARRAR